jgi:hypothetical protein
MADEGTGGRASPLGNASEVERRRAARYLADLRVTCYPAGGGLGGGRVARVRNISRTGIGLVVDRHWGPGTAVSLALPLGEEGRDRSCVARVVHATAQPGGCFLVGCAFVAALTEDELQAVLAGPTIQPEPETDAPEHRVRLRGR